MTIFLYKTSFYQIIYEKRSKQDDIFVNFKLALLNLLLHFTFSTMDKKIIVMVFSPLTALELKRVRLHISNFIHVLNASHRRVVVHSLSSGVYNFESGGGDKCIPQLFDVLNFTRSDYILLYR